VQILVSHDLLMNQLKRDSGRIAAGFDVPCESDIKKVSKLLAQASTLLVRAMQFTVCRGACSSRRVSPYEKTPSAA
jgi:hypothetical protein